jgi:phage gp29-like protein
MANVTALPDQQPSPVAEDSNPYPRVAKNRGRFVELPLQPLVNLAAPWVVSSILAEHDLGQFQRSALLWEHMRRDDRIAATIGVRINALLGLEHDFKPRPGTPELDDGDDSQQQAIEKLDGVWAKFATPDERRQILSWALGVGFAFGRLDWEYSASEWVPRISIWHPSFVTWRQTELLYYVSTANQSQVPITPNQDGWWLYTPFGYKRGWAEGFVHKLAMPWLARTFAYRDWCRYNEIHGLPMIKAFVPYNVQDDDELRFMTELANRGQSPAIRLPKSKENTAAYDFELVEATADTWEAFQGMKNDANTDIAVAVLGQNLTTEVDGKGSYAAAKVQDKVRGDILDADAKSLEAWFDDAVILPYAAVNLPGGTDDAPALRFQTQETDDLLKAGEGLGLLGDGVMKAVQAGIKVDVDEVCKRVDVPTTGAWEEREQPQGGGAAGSDPFGKVQPGRLDKAAQKPNPLLASEGLGLPSAKTTQEQGQAYADALVAAFTEQGAAVLNEDRLKVLSVIMGADSLEEMRHLLEKAYAEMDPKALAELMTTATSLAELNGWFSARGV